MKLNKELVVALVTTIEDRARMRTGAIRAINESVRPLGNDPDDICPLSETQTKAVKILGDEWKELNAVSEALKTGDVVVLPEMAKYVLGMSEGEPCVVMITAEGRDVIQTYKTTEAANEGVKKWTAKEEKAVKAENRRILTALNLI